MLFVCGTHGHCFDGLASAVTFTHLLRQLRPEAKLTYRACGYGPNQQKPDARLLVGEENAILDYRFYDVPRLTWYFDHHRTAFATPQDEAAFRELQASSPDRFVFNPEYTSCTKLIADVASRRFGIALPELAPLVEWADAIDSARFDSPELATDFSNPIMQLAAVVEHYGDDRYLAKLVPALLEEPLDLVARSKLVTAKFKGLGPRYDRFLKRVRERGHLRGRVVHVDLTEATVDAVAKFATYALFPEAVYSVMVGLMSSAVKISVGYNPWSGADRDVDISNICSRWGGGGHPVVGGIAFPRSELERAQAVAAQIADELNH